MIEYTNPDMVTGVKVTKTPVNRSATGYGPKLPSRFMVHYAGRWRRVYVAQYGNAGTAFIVHGGKHLVLDADTEYRVNGTVAA